MKTEYHHTVFQALPEELPPAFCIITAWNPDGQPRLATKNRQSDAELVAQLDAYSLPRTRITGLSPDESHAEPGWAVGCAREQGIAIGREYGQEGIYQVEGGELTLVDCSTGEEKPLGAFGTRLRDPRDLREFRIYVGSRAPRAQLQATEEEAIRLKVAGRFDAFTITRAEGCFRAQSEDALVITVATDRSGEVLGAAKDIRKLLGQEGIGVSCGGVYQRVREWTDPDFLLRVWGLAGREGITEPTSVNFPDRWQNHAALGTTSELATPSSPKMTQRKKTLWKKTLWKKTL